MNKSLPAGVTAEQPGVTAAPVAADPAEKDKGIIVLYDECGDTLWDAVLAQHNSEVH